MKGKEIMQFLKSLDECQEKTEVLIPGRETAYNNLELISKYKERSRLAYEKV